MDVFNRNIQPLSDYYRQAEDGSIALFLGAGVNLPSGNVSVSYKTYTWPSLLKALFAQNQDRLSRSFEELGSVHKNNWIAYADYLYEQLSEEELIEQIDQLFYSSIPRQDTQYRRLSKRFWDQAPTLQAAVSFCSEIKPLEPEKPSWRFKRSRKIGKVITTNYDFFFGAAWTRYEGFSKQWKVETPFSTSDLREGQAPIEYIHGYLPYIRKKDKKSETKGLVLSQQTYDECYQEGKFTLEALRDAVSNYSLIFVGLSLSDPPLIEMLQEIPQEQRPPHFAIIPSHEVENVTGLGVIPIEITDYAQIKSVLEKVYSSGVTSEVIEHFSFERPEQYWERLLLGKKDS